MSYDRRLADAARHRRCRAWLDSLKRQPCMDCGGTFPPCCMDFDHRDGAQKTTDVSKLIHSPEALRAEVSLCDVVCSNCHRIRTAERGQYSAPGKRVDDVQPGLPFEVTQ